MITGISAMNSLVRWIEHEELQGSLDFACRFAS